MATVNEEEQQRETLPPVPAQPDSPPEDVTLAPSAEPIQEPESSEQAPPQQATTPEPEAGEVPFNKHPRWIERQQELERERASRAELERQNRLLLETMQRVAPQPPPPQAPDFWAGRIDHPDPATAQYWQGQKQMFELAAEQGKQRALAELSPVIQAGMAKLAAIDTKTFRQENPDIVVGSQEEAMVIAYMEGRVDGVRHPIESARNNAVIKKLETEVKALRARQATTPAKRAAARVESGNGIPASAGGPAPQGDWRQRGSEVIDQGGSLLDVARAVFGTGGKRRPA